MRRWLLKLRRGGLATQSAALLVAVLVVYALAAPVAARLGGGDGLWAAAVAAALCLVGAESALIAGRRFRGTKHALWDLLVGMHLRMGIPLVFGLIFQLRKGVLADAGILYYLLVFYPVTLALEVMLSLPPTAQQHPDNGAAT